MPDDRVRVQLKDGRKGTVNRADVQSVIANGGTLLDEEGALTKAGRGATLGAFSGLGIAETQNPLQDTIKNLLRQSSETAVRFPKEVSEKGLPYAIGQESLGVAKSFGEPVKEIYRGVKGKDIEEASHGLSSLIIQLLMLRKGKEAAETPLREGTVAKGAQKFILEKAGAGESTVAGEAAKATEKGKEFKSEAQQKLAEARGKHEQEVAAREKEIAERKAEHTKKVEAAEKTTAASAAKEASARLRNQRLSIARERLRAYRERAVKETSENIDASEKAERTSLDSRWDKWNGMVKSLKGNLSKVGDAVVQAEKEDIKGSKENIKVFRDVLGKLKENMIESPDGGIKFIDNQMVGLDQMRGYWQELGDSIYNKELPYDVRTALERVRNGVEEQIRSSVLDNYGADAGGKIMEMYDTLKADWSDYKRTWYDTSSVNPLPRIIRILRDPVTVKSGVDVSGKVADILGQKHMGQAAGTLLGKKSMFGAKPSLVERLNASTGKLKSFSDLEKTVTPTKIGKFPGEFEEPPPISEAKVSLPSPPEEFEPRQFKREKVQDLAQRLKKYGWGDIGLFIALEELMRGRPETAAGAAAYPIGKQVAGRIMERPSVLDWLVQ